jgi:beta-glucanase (GH16 family)
MIRRRLANPLALAAVIVSMTCLPYLNASQSLVSAQGFVSKLVVANDRQNARNILQFSHPGITTTPVLIQPYVDLSPETSNLPVKPGWNLIFDDELNGSKNSNWKLGYCWGNSLSDVPYYNKATNFDLSSGSSLKLITRKETYAPPAYPVIKYFTTATMGSSDCSQSLTEVPGHLFKYGYFEIRARNPFGQQMWPAFWLFGEPNSRSSWNEIDVFEFGVGDNVVLTNHYKAPGGMHQTSNDWIRSMPGQTFGNTWVTYAIKWEPNKIVWYINNKPVRIVSDQNGAIIPDVAMNVIVNSGNNERANSDLNLPDTLPNSMEVDYVRIYKRPDHTKPDPVFTINGKQGFEITSAVTVPLGVALPVTLDAATSYMPNHHYFVSVQECQSDGTLIGAEAMGWLTLAQVATVHDFDLRAFAQKRGVTLQPGHYYRVKLANESPWTENNQYIYATSCANDMVFSVNGSDLTSWPTPINITYSYGKPGIRVDASSAVSCSNNFFVSVQACTATGNPSGSEVARWLNSTEVKHRGYLDLRAFTHQFAFDLSYGAYYRVKLATDFPWTERVQIIRIQPCNTSISYKVNGQVPSGFSPTLIDNGRDIILDGTASTLCNDNYFISVQKSYANGTPVPGSAEIQQWIEGTAVGHFDVRAFARSKGLVLECGSNYRVKMASGSPWVEKTSLIYIKPCGNVNNHFMVNYVDQPSYNFGDPAALDVILYARDALSCDQNYFVSVQKRVNGVPAGKEVMAWLTQSQIYSLQILGTFDLKAFASDPNQDGNTADGITLTNDSTYRVKFVPSAGGCNANSWLENVKIIYFGTGSG